MDCCKSAAALPLPWPPAPCDLPPIVVLFHAQPDPAGTNTVEATHMQFACHKDGRQPSTSGQRAQHAQHAQQGNLPHWSHNPRPRSDR